MKLFTPVVLALAVLLASANVHAESGISTERKLYAEAENEPVYTQPEPKPNHSGGGGGGSGGGGSGGGGSGGGGSGTSTSSGGSSSGSSSGSGGSSSSSSSSGGSSSGGSSSGSGGSSSSSSSGGGSSSSSGGGDGSSGSSSGSSSGGGGGGDGSYATNGAQHDASGFIRGSKAQPARKGAMIMLATAAVAGAMIAAVVIKKRKVTEKQHPLKGALNRRIQLFSNLANHHDDAARPPRRYDEEKFYNAEYVLPEGKQ